MMEHQYPHPSTLHTEAEILAVRESLPQVHNGDAMQPYKAQLNRRLHTIRARGLVPVDRATMLQLVAEAPDVCPHCQGPMGFMSHNNSAGTTLHIVCHKCAAA